MLKEYLYRLLHNLSAYVLILILMEHAQRALSYEVKQLKIAVLILILMEHAQREEEVYQC